jgi:hypothetical protein
MSEWFPTRGGFHKSWAYGVKPRVHPNLGENAISWRQRANAWCQSRVNLCKKDGRRAQNYSIGHKLLCEIHPRSCLKNKSKTHWPIQIFNWKNTWMESFHKVWIWHEVNFFNVSLENTLVSVITEVLSKVIDLAIFLSLLKMVSYINTFKLLVFIWFLSKYI